MVVTKEMKRVAKCADYAFIHVDNMKAALELMRSKDERGDFNPNHVATYDGIDCEFNDYSAQYSYYRGKARIYVDTYEAKSLLSLIQVLHVDTEIKFRVAAGNNNDVLNQAHLVNDNVFLAAFKNRKEIGEFLIMAHAGRDNTARPIQYR